jgi:hypothetical protein
VDQYDRSVAGYESHALERCNEPIERISHLAHMLEFGSGSGANLEHLVAFQYTSINWPGAETKTYGPFALDQHVVIEE